MSGGDPDRLRTVEEVRRYLGVPISTLFGWHLRGEGPPVYTIDGKLKYRAVEVETWLRTRMGIIGDVLDEGQ